MKRIVITACLLLFSSVQIFSGSVSTHLTLTAGNPGNPTGLATIANGMTLLLMMSAFYMIGKNFMLEGRINTLREKVKVFFRP